MVEEELVMMDELVMVLVVVVMVKGQVVILDGDETNTKKSKISCNSFF